MKRFLLIERDQKYVAKGLKAIQASLQMSCSQVWAQVGADPGLWRIGCNKEIVAEVRITYSVDDGFSRLAQDGPWNLAIADLEMLHPDPQQLLATFSQYCTVLATTNAPDSDRARYTREQFTVIAKTDLASHLSV